MDILNNLFSLEFLSSAVIVLLLFGGTILVHELGHFLTAKWFNLRIDAFSIGMGPALWKKKINGVVYKISLLPIGGYVALPQMDITGSAFENQDAKEGKLEPVAPYKRIIIAAAGPFMNVLAAFILCLVVWGVGKPYDPGPEPAVVGWVNPDSPAHKAGLREGDLIREVNEDRIHFWTDFIIATSLNQSLDLKVHRDGEIHYLHGMETKRNPLGFLHLPGVGPREHVEHVIAAGLMEDSPAARSGLQEGDILHKLNDTPIESTNQFRELIQASQGEPVNLTVLRGAPPETRSLTLAAEADPDTDVWLIGILMGEEYKEVMVNPEPLTQMRYFSGVIFRTLRGLMRPRERAEAAGGVGGPAIMIGSIHQQVQLHPMQALWFIALINVNLAIINLLPLIVLDGGHIMVASWEWITGRTVNQRIMIAAANIMVVVLIGLMITLTFKDVLFYRRLHAWQNDQQQEQEQQAEPTPEPTPEEENNTHNNS